MGLENLQNLSPVYNNHEINIPDNQPTSENSLLTGEDFYPPTQMEDIFGKIGSAVDHFPSPILGFTLNQEVGESLYTTDGGTYVRPESTENLLGKIENHVARSKPKPSTYQWDKLYNADHTGILDDRLNIRYGSVDEPFVVTDIGSREAGGRILIGDRNTKDMMRIGKFYTTWRGAAWHLTQHTFQFLNPRSHRLFNSAKVLASGIPVPGGLKFRFNRGSDWTAGESIFGVDLPYTGDIYTNTIDELTNGVGIYGNKFQAEQGASKLFVAPTPYDKTFLPLAIRDSALETKISATESPLLPVFGNDGYGMNKETFLSRALTKPYTNLHFYASSDRIIPNSLLTIPSIEEPEFIIPKVAGSEHFKKQESRFNGLAKLKQLDIRIGNGIDANISNHASNQAQGQSGTYESISPPRDINKSIDSRVEKALGWGDFQTLIPMKQGKKLSDAFGAGGQDEIESSTNGMPFYFQDLRDNTFIILRGFIDGITENVAPSWTTVNYIGRSAPVYNYERAERDMSFNLKLFAHTANELDSLYKKINRLTSLCYPEYKVDEKLGSKVRMKAPLTKFRMGELYGSRNNEVTGFIKSLTYTVPDESPWETVNGKRVPKFVTAAITYQIIHNEAPSLRFTQKGSGKGIDFYGINSKVGVE